MNSMSSRQQHHPQCITTIITSVILLLLSSTMSMCNAQVAIAAPLLSPSHLIRATSDPLNITITCTTANSIPQVNITLNSNSTATFATTLYKYV